MKINPVYKRETTVSARSFRLALMVLIFNGILAVVALLNMYSVISRVRMTAEIQYSSFLDMYTFVATVEFIMLIFIIPALTSGSISGERERQTLELMLTTKMTPVQIITGKLFSSLSTAGILIISSFPILALVFIYGGITIPDVLMLLLCYAATAFLAGSLGICFSSIFKRSTLATAVSYGALIVLIGGTYVLNRFALSLAQMNVNSYAQNIGSVAQQANSGGFLYLLLLNPAATFYVTIVDQVGNNPMTGEVTRWFGMRSANFLTENWGLCSIGVQVLLALIFLWIAVHYINPRKK